MAIKQSLSRSDNRIKAEFPAAYFRVMSVEMREDGSSRIRVAAFADADARKLALAADAGGAAHMPGMMRGPGETNATIWEKTFDATLGAAPEKTYANLQEQAKAAAYLHLKALPEFTTGEDC